MSSLEARSAALQATAAANADGPSTPSMSGARAMAYVVALVVGVPLGLVLGIIVALMLGLFGGGVDC